MAFAALRRALIGQAAGRMRALRGFASTAEGTESVVNGIPVKVFNPNGKLRVVVTKDLPGKRWVDVLAAADCRVEVCRLETVILDPPTITKLIGPRCDGAIGQLTEDWGDALFGALKRAGGRAYSNYAVGYNNVDVPAATRHGIPVGNTPGVLTETTAEIAAALTLAAARRVAEADAFMRAGHYKGWLPGLFVGQLLQRKTVGIIGAGRIGTAYARMMVEGHKMNVVYYDLYPSKALESYVAAYGAFLVSQGEPAVTCTRLPTTDAVLAAADVVSLHCNLDATTKGMMNARTLALMKPDAVLVNSSRGPVIDEAALVNRLRAFPDFRCGLDVFEHEPDMAPGLADCPNAVILPHIASASSWTREGMAALAAANVAARLQGLPVWTDLDIQAFVDPAPLAAAPKASPSIVNAKELSLPTMGKA